MHMTVYSGTIAEDICCQVRKLSQLVDTSNAVECARYLWVPGTKLSHTRLVGLLEDLECVVVLALSSLPCLVSTIPM